MEKVVIYTIFGVTIWTRRVKINVADEEAVYQRLSERFAKEMQAALDFARKGK